ncbi:hypothetical protein ARMGADRAFT_1081776 [Armillaria gallica]|uniref:Uncharacterized protein n=1 Tax=Armillaria gallica TaxID=47427 RepID=A0A2H3DBW6_ARMGA|nr:hypothetical protein ARMGADRAFT_1081776 [Armillaria gallica]
MFSLALLPLALALAAKGDSWGPAYSLGPTNSAIIEAITTFTPGTPPSDAENYLFLWPGISNSTSGLIQAGTNQTADQNSYCGASQDQWCAMASYYGVVDGVTTQLNGDMVPIDANASITIHYKLADDNVTWEQTVTLNGEVVSNLTSSDGPLYNGGWGTGTECQQDCTGTTSPQYYKNTTITLLEADPDFSSTLSMGDGVEASTMATSDDGKTWTIDSITIPAMVSDNSSSLSSSSSKSMSATSSPNVVASTTSSRTSTALAVTISTSAIPAASSATSSSNSEGTSAGEPNENPSMFSAAISGSPVGGSVSTSQPTGLLGDNQSSGQAVPSGGSESSFPTASSSADGLLPSGEAGDVSFGGPGNGSSTNETSGALPSDGAGSANATAAASGPAYSATSPSDFVKRFFRYKRQSESTTESTATSASALSAASASSPEANSTNDPGEFASGSASSLPTNFPTSTFNTNGSFPSGSADGCACGGGLSGDDFGSASGSTFPTAVFGSAASLPTDVSDSAFSGGADDLSTAAAAMPSGSGSAEGPFSSGEVSSGGCDCNGIAGGSSFPSANEAPFPTDSNEGALPTGESGSPSQAGIAESGSVATITTSRVTSTSSGSGSVPSSSSPSSSNFRRVPRHGIWERLNRRVSNPASSATAGPNDPPTATTPPASPRSSGEASGSSDALPTWISANSPPASFPTGDEGTGESEGPFPTASTSVIGSFPSDVSSSGFGGAEGDLGGEGEASNTGEYSVLATAANSFPSSIGV